MKNNKGNQNVLTRSDKLSVFQINPKIVIKIQEMFKEITKSVNTVYLIKKKKIKCRNFARPAIGIAEKPEVFVISFSASKIGKWLEEMTNKYIRV